MLHNGSEFHVIGRAARPRAVWGAVLAVACALVSPLTPAADLGSARLQIAGTTLVLSPASQSVPFDTPTLVETALDGYDVALGQLPADLRVLGDFSGPEVDGTLVLETVPNEPFRIPRLQLEGEYRLADVRLVQGDEVLAYAEPRSARVRVTQIVLTRVSSRALTLDEIRAYGLAIDDDSFQAMNLTFAFGTSGQVIEYGMPVVYNSYGPDVRFAPGEPNLQLPQYSDLQRNTLSTHFVPPRAVPFTVRSDRGCTKPNAVWDPSVQRAFCPVKVGGCEASGACREILPPERALVGVLLFPTDVSLLHQFFSVALVMQNGAEEGDPLVLRDLFAQILLPRGLRRGTTDPPTLVGLPVPVRAAGPDGEVGTGDDLTMLVAQAQGDAEWLVEGLQEGTHVVTVDIEGVLDGLPGTGPQPINAQAQGAVAVRDPRLAVHVAHPQVVRQGIEYPLYYTVTNIGTAPVNLISLTLPAHALSGVVMAGPATQTIGALAPGDSETVEFRVESQRTGRMISSSVKTGSYIEPSFEWSVEVGAGRSLSPDALNLPDAAEHLPPDLLDPALGLIGLGYSLVTAPPSLRSGLPRVGKVTVNERIYQLSQAGRHVHLGEETFDVAAILAAEFLGRDWDWDQLRRDSRKSGQLAAAVAARLSAAASTPVDVFDRFAATTHYLGPQVVLAAGAGVTVEVASRTSGKTAAGAGGDPDRRRELPFAELYGLAGGEMVVVSEPEEGGYAVRLRHAAGGIAGLHLLVPDAAGALRAVRWSGVSLTSAGAAEVRFQAADTAFVLDVDDDGDGAADRQETGVVETLAPRAFTALAAVQVSDVDASAHVMDVLFSEPVDLASLAPRDPQHFELPDNLSNGGLIQVEADIALGLLEGYGTIENPLAGLSNPRVVQVVFDNPVSPLVAQTLTVRDLAGESGQLLVTQQVPVTLTASTNAVQVVGTLYGPDGQPVPNAAVALYEHDLTGIGGNIVCVLHATAVTTTDAGGQFQFGYVRQTECGGVFEVKAQDPATGFFGTATGKVRLLGQTLRLDMVMPGRGSVRGQVRYNDGTVPRTFRVLARNSEAGRGRGRLAHVDTATGRYDIDHLVTGTVTLAADDGEGSFTYKTIELPEPGAVVEQDLVILRRSELVSTPPGQLRGRVADAVDGSPVFDAFVAISYGESFYAAVQRTDTDGRFDFGPLPTGVVRIEVFNEKSAVSGDSAAQVYAEISPDRVTDVDVLLRNAVGTVEGHVYLKSWNGLVTPLAETVVWAEGTPFHAMTDAAGYYRLDDMFEGTWQINAVLFDTAAWGMDQMRVAAQVTITSAGGVVSRDLYFQEPLPQGGIIGQVLGYDGAPVANALIHLSGGYESTRWHHEAHSDANGYFKIDELPPGTYGVHAMSGDAGGIGWAEIRYPGQTAWTTVRFRQGTIRGRTMARTGADGTPVGVLSQIAYRATHVSTWAIVVVDADYTYLETDLDGNFEIPALVGPYEIHVYNAFHGTRSVRGSLDYDGQVAEHEFIFEENGTIRGVLYDYDGETPVAGAQVNLTGGNFAVYDVHTDAEGRFEFPLVPPRIGGYHIEVLYDDGAIFRRQETTVYLRQFGEEIDVEMSLLAQGSVVGWVEDSNANPVPGAVVTLIENHYPGRRLVHNADAEGNFAFDNVFVGTATVYAQAPALGGLGGRTVVPLTAEAEEAVAVVTLEDVGELVGRVTTPVDGSAVPLAEIRLRGRSTDFATADDAGEYRFRLLPLGWYYVAAYDQATGRRGRSEWVEIAANNQVAVADTVLESRGVVDGHLSDGNTGQGIPGAIVRLTVWDRVTAYAVTDETGFFEFGGIPEGSLYLTAHDSTGRRNVWVEGTLAEEDERVTIDLYLAPTGQVTGQILNPVGLVDGPFAGSVNVILNQNGRVIDATFDNPYALEGLVAGHPFKVIAQENGGLRRGEATGRLGLAGGALVLDVRLQAIGAVTIEVVDSFGNPVPGADVLLHNRHAYGGESFLASTGSDHAVTFADVREGALWARGTDPVTGLQGTVTGSLASEGEQVTLQVQLQDTGTIRGRVVLTDGVTPAAFASAALRRGNKWYLGETDEDGFFSFTAIPLGSFELSFQERDGLGLRDVFGALTANGEIIELGTVVLDDRDPWVVSVEPPSGARDLPLSTLVTVTFSEPMDASRQQSSTFVLRRRDYGDVARTYAWSADQTAVTVIPTSPLVSGTTYDLYVAQETYDLAGRSLDWRLRTSFTTADVIPPAVIDTLPRNGDVQVPLDTFILVTFSEPVELASLSGGALQLTDLTAGQGLTTTFQLRPSEREIIVTPVNPLYADRDIQLTVQGVRDLAGNVMAAPASIVFWTPDETLPQLAWQSPAAGATFTSGDNVPILVDASDNRGLSETRLTIGEWSTVLAADGSPSETFSWDVPAPVVAVASDVAISAVVTDIYGNQQSFTRTIRVEPLTNASPPVVVEACPNVGDHVAAGLTIPITFSVADDVAIESYWLQVDGVIIEKVTPVNQPDADVTFLWAPPGGAVPGTVFDARLGARDFSGNVDEVALSLQVPTVSVLSGDQDVFPNGGQALALAAGRFDLGASQSFSSVRLLYGAELIVADAAWFQVAAPGTVRLQCGSRVEAPAASLNGLEVDRDAVYAGTSLTAATISLTGKMAALVDGVLTLETDTFRIEPDGRLDVSGLGYAGGSGGDGEAPAGVVASTKSAGGSHGGGGDARGSAAGPAGEVYDSVYEPSLAGAGGAGASGIGGAGGSGGGVVEIAAGTLVLDGEILARGLDGTVLHGGGAGGTVVIRAAELSGSGLVDAGGGDHGPYSCYGGGGGGGRIALWVDGLTSFDPSTQLRVWSGKADCATPPVYAAPGTVFIHTPTSTYGALVIDSAAPDGSPLGVTELPTLGSGDLSSFEISGADAWLTAPQSFAARWSGAWVVLLDVSGAELGSYRVAELDGAGRARAEGAGAVSGATSYRGEYRFDSIDLLHGSGLVVSDPVKTTDLVLNGDTEVSGELTADTAVVRTGAWVRPVTGGSLRFEVSGTLTIEAGARLDVSGLGYAGGSGGDGDAPAGVVASTKSAGGSHGGRGDARSSAAGPAGEVYDSVYEPWLAGAGGAGSEGTGAAGGAGGGVVEIAAGTLVLDGEILARGLDGTLLHGGGAGGTVVIRTAELSGSGLVDAGGGDHGPYSCYGGGGGGGRIALWVDGSTSFDPSTQLRARSGKADCATPPVYAAPGTVFISTATSIWGDLRIEHGDPTAVVEATLLPAIGRGIVGAVAVDAAAPADLWIEPQDPAAQFSVGVLGMWVRINGVDYPVVGEGGDRRSLLLQGAAGAVAVGDLYLGIYKFDTVTVAGGVELVLRDHNEVTTWDVDPTSQVTLLDVSPPVFHGVTPAAGASLTSGDTVTVTVDVTDPETSVTRVVFAWAGQTYVDDAAPWSWTTRAPAVSAAGDSTLTLEAFDTEENASSMAHTLHLEPLPPAPAPAVAYACPTPLVSPPTPATALLELVPGGELDVVVDAFDPLGVERVELFLDGAATPAATDFFAPYTYTLVAPATAVAGDVLTLTARATNYAAATAEVTIAVPVVERTFLQGDQTLDSTWNGQEIVLGRGTYTVTEPLDLTGLTLLSGAVVTTGTALVPLEINAGELTVHCGAAIDQSEIGYAGGGSWAAGEAPAWVTPSGLQAGGSHGGRGWDGGGGSPGDVFGSIYQPALGGGGGGAFNASQWGGAGGGIITITAPSRIVLAGEIRAEGQDTRGGQDRAGTGAGGSIVIDTAQIVGGGRISAAGHDYHAIKDVSDQWGDSRINGGGGGGGRIALFIDNLVGFDVLNQADATGGRRFQLDGTLSGVAAPGTIYLVKPTSTWGELIINAGGESADPQAAPVVPTELPALGSGAVTDLVDDANGLDAWLTGPAAFTPRWLGVWVELRDLGDTPLGTYRVLDLDATGRLLLEGAAGVGGAATWTGEYRFDSVTVLGGAGLEAQPADPVIATTVELTGTVDLGASIRSQNLTIGAGAVVRSQVPELRLTATESLRIEGGALLDASGAGYAGGESVSSVGQPGEVPAGVTPSARSAGGSHGGRGLDGQVGTAGEIFDSVYLPVYGGGGGAGYNGANFGGAGGGVVILEAAAVELDGEVRSRGLDHHPATTGAVVGAGAGGTVVVRSDLLSGSGTIDVAGGDHSITVWGQGGAGGGGRVALEVGSLSFDVAAQVVLRGGTRRNVDGTVESHAAAGTAFVFDATSTYGSLFVRGDAAVGETVGRTALPAIGRDVVANPVASNDPGDFWIEPGDAAAQLDWGVNGMWVRVDGVDYRVAGQGADRRTMLLTGAAGVTAGKDYAGYYKFDSVTVLGGARLELLDFSEVASWSVDAGSEVQRPDQEPPVIGAVTPADGATFQAGDTIVVTAEVTDDPSGVDYGVASVTLHFDGQSLVDTVAPYEWTLTAPLAAGDYLLTLDAVDLTGNAAVPVVRTVHVLAADPPSVAILCPSGGALLAPSTGLDVTVAAAHGQGIDRVEISVDGVLAGTLTAAPYVLRVNAPGTAVAGQILSVEAVAYSTVGSAAAATVTFQVVEGTVLAASTAIAAGDTTYDGTTLVVAAGTLTIDGVHSFADLVVLDGATVTHSATTAGAAGALEVGLTGRLYVACGGRIDADGRGYLAGTGHPNDPATGAAAGVGGSHGGRGGFFDTAAGGAIYGDLFDPADPGAGGGGASASAGGGVIRLAAAGDVVVDGAVRARGGQDGVDVAHGAGGSIRLDGSTLRGLGSIDASGAGSAGASAGGGGGRIALYGTAIDAALLVRARALGGNASTAPARGAAGTVFVKRDADPYGELHVVNVDAGGNTVVSTQITELPALGGTYGFGRVVVDGAATLVTVDAVQASSPAEVGPGSLYLPSYAPSITITVPADGTTLAPGQAFTVEAVVDDLLGVMEVTETFDGASAVDAAAPFSWTETAPFVGAMTPMTIAVDATDLGGHPLADTIVVTVEPIAGNAPVVVLGGCPADQDLVVPGQVLSVPFTATDDEQVTSWTLRVDGIEVETQAVAGAAVSASPSWTVPLDAAPGQTFTVRVEAADQVGAVGFSLIQVVVPTSYLAGPASFDATWNGQSLILGPGTFTVTEPLSLSSVTLTGGAVLTGEPHEVLDLTFSGTLAVQCNAAIDVSGQGYNRAETYPGAILPGNGSGGSHLGIGGQYSTSAVGSTYGSVVRPQEPGGGGDNSTSGRSGGGVVRIVANGVTLAAGSAILANGDGYVSGDAWIRGGAGGSVWLTVSGALSGDGTIEARGGVSGLNHAGSGGGGAIAVEYGTSAGTVLDNLRAEGGSNQVVGGAGTTYLVGPTSVYGDLVVDDGSIVGGRTMLPSLGAGVAQGGSGGSVLVLDRAPVPAYFVGHWVEVRDGTTGNLRGTWRITAIDVSTVTLETLGGGPVSVQPGDLWQGVYLFDNLSIRGDVSLASADPIRVEGTQEISGTVELLEILAGDLVLRSGTVLTHPPTTDPAAPEGLRIELTGGLTLEAGAEIDVTGRGFQRHTSYPGETLPAANSGGCHLGIGGQYGTSALGSTFGSVYRPQEPGGGSGQTNATYGRSGGGVVRVIATDVTLAAGSAIRANGVGYVSGDSQWTEGAAGGSVWITVSGVLAGDGVIEARGGVAGANKPGSGGGGTIAVEYGTSAGTVLDNLRSLGGENPGVGGAGTVYLFSSTSTYGDLILDNGLTVGGRTRLPSLGIGLAQAGSAGEVLVTDKAMVPAYFVGHWVEVYAGASGSLRGTWRIANTDGGALTLEAGTGGPVSIFPGDVWQGVYRFDNLNMVGDHHWESEDPVRVTVTQEIAGTVEARAITAHDLVLRSGTVLTHPPTTDPAAPESLRIELSGDLTLESGAAIDVTGLGFQRHTSYPGETLPAANSGGSHLGFGGQYGTSALGSTFGSVYRPHEPGGGSGHTNVTYGRAGGGVVRIVAADVTLAAGSAIRANGVGFVTGNNQWTEGAAGGSVWITASGVLTGDGTIEARGGLAGANKPGSGGGGAIAVEYGTSAGTVLDNLRAMGGENPDVGGAGTVFLLSPTSTYGDLILDNGLAVGGRTRLPSLGVGLAQAGSGGDVLVTDQASVPAYFVGHWVEVYDGASGSLRGTWRIASIDGGALTLAADVGGPVSVLPDDVWQGVYRFDNLTMVGDHSWESEDPVRVSVTQEIAGTVEARKIIAGDLVLRSGTVLTHPPTTDPAAPEGLRIELSGTLTLESGAEIDVTGRGFARAKTYPGGTLPGIGSGGSHLGIGGKYSTSAVGSTFGSVYRPREPGGGGDNSSSGRSGGGVVRIVANDAMLATGSAILANGDGYVSGDAWIRGGAGGSVWLTVSGAVTGDGVIEAQGGVSGPNHAGSGGGGAIAVEYGSSSGTVLDNLRAWGGQNTVVGGAGTVLLVGPASSHGDLIVDNGGLSGQGAELPALGAGTALAGSTGSLLVTDRATAIPPFFVGHWVQVSAADATPKGTYRIASVEGVSATLEADVGETISLEPGDLWQGVYRFDAVTVVGGAVLTSVDPVITP